MTGKTILHYKIIKELGRGGMGIVCLAEDTKLKRQVAIKFLPSHLSSGTEDGKRFKIEAQAAAALNHPNIAHIYAIEEVDGQLFIVMEYIEGRELREILASTNLMPLPLEEITDYATQIAKGLRAAHSKGIIHRDIKSSNIMVTEDNQIKIMDFGLAKISGSTRITQVGTVLGTIAYMSPEQLLGSEIDHRADIWAFGVVLNEMLTGALPFNESVDQLTVYAILNDEPKPPSKSRDDIPKEVDLITAKAMIKDVDERYQSMDDVLSDLKTLLGANVETGKRRSVNIRPKPFFFPNFFSKRLLNVASLLVLFAGSLGLGFWLNKVNSQKTGYFFDSTIKSRPSIAVLGFKNLTAREEADWLSTALSEMLTTEIAIGEQLRTIPGEVVSRMKQELAIDESESFSKKTLGQIRQNLGTDLVVVGSFLSLPQGGNTNQIRLDLRLQDTLGGETIISLTDSGEENELFDLVNRIGTELRNKLGVSELTSEKLTSLAASRPANIETAKLYAQGLKRLRLYDAKNAVELFERAVEVEPDFPLVHLALSQGWLQLGYDNKALAAANRALELSQHLTYEEQFLIEAHYNAVKHNWDESAEIYQKLWESFPDNLEYGLGLANAKTRAGKTDEALITIEELKNLPEPLSQDARIYIAEAIAAGEIPDYNRQREASVKARVKALEQGATSIVADSWIYEGNSLDDLGEIDKAIAAFEEAKRLYEMTGHRSNEADAIASIAFMQRQKGNIKQYQELNEKALAMKAEVGDQYGFSRIANNLAIAFKIQGKLEKAKVLYQKSIDIRRELGNKTRLPNPLNNLGNLLNVQGDLEGAKKLYMEGMTIADEVGNKYYRGLLRYNLSMAYYRSGDLAQSQKYSEEALYFYTQIGSSRHRATALDQLANVAFDMGELEKARALYDSSLTLRIEFDPSNVVYTQFTIAQIETEKKNYDLAEDIVRETLEEYKDYTTNVEVAFGDAILARILARQKRSEEALALARKAITMVPADENRYYHIAIDVTAADAIVESNQFEEGKKILEEAVEQARDVNFVPLLYQAKLVQGTAEFKYGDTKIGIKTLMELSSAAEDKQFYYIANKAKEVIGAS